MHLYAGERAFGSGSEVRPVVMVPWERGWRCGSKTQNMIWLSVITPRPSATMFDPQGSHKEMAASSYVDEAAKTTLTLSDLPPELILRIASLLEVGDLLALRRVCFRSNNLKSP